MRLTSAKGLPSVYMRRLLNCLPPLARACLLWALGRLAFWPVVIWHKLCWRKPAGHPLWDRVHPFIVLGAVPVFESDITALHEQEGVKCVVNLCEEWGGRKKLYDRLGMVQVHLPTVDRTYPSQRHCDAGVQAMRHHIERKETVYVHCMAGKGRSVTLVLCYLVAYEGMSPEEAQAHVNKGRPIAKKKWHAPPVQWYWQQSLSGRAPTGKPLA